MMEINHTEKDGLLTTLLLLLKLNQTWAQEEVLLVEDPQLANNNNQLKPKLIPDPKPDKEVNLQTPDTMLDLVVLNNSNNKTPSKNKLMLLPP